ncbi:hypothetical protein SAMN05421874_104150 [Nonomuraea maritima]|uniref:Uncharacterized protein n=1 Tax=Nonomuraea maritima TaxID=683260 RepID=A0A1G8XUQ0_9ACTN|nr:hypothetical protein [Nonomuraea maritima]SDJ94309.1 hypothetical protein SAMN05421874_104150 [Nonomuraea maritima]
MITMFGCGALFPATAASAEGPENSGSLLMQATGADLGQVMSTLPSVFCGNRLVAYNSPSDNSPTNCVNGPENSGNSTNSGNYHHEGTAINSGNFSNTNGSTASGNTINGGNTANGSQSVEPAG